MKIRLQRRPRGMAIIIVMVCIFILGLLAGGFASSMKVETKLAMNANNETEMEWMGRSGIEMARYVLGQQMKLPNSQYDSLNQKWAGGPGGTNDILSSISLTDVTLGHGHFSVKIIDNERKFNINSIRNNEVLLGQTLRLLGVDGADVPIIIGSIQDWIDVDETTHPNGAESDYYQSLNPPYYAKNGPIDDISELLFIKGVTPDVFWGPNAADHPPTMFQQSQPTGRNNSLLPTTGIVSAGLADIFTPVSSGLININTASQNVLQMIPGVSESVAADILRLRSGPDGQDGTEDDMPLQSVGQLVNAGLSNQGAQAIGAYCTVRSTTFEVQVDVEVGLSKRRYYALLHRNTPNDIQILTLHWE